MRLLLPMAYAVLYIMKNTRYVTCVKPQNSDDQNLTYRLMEVDLDDKSDDNVFDDDSKSTPTNHHGPKRIIVDDRSVERPIQEPNFENILPARKPYSTIPDDFQKEISQIRIPKYLPNRVKNEPKHEVKPNSDEEEEEEEEEIEEKRQEIRTKITKKKRPQNVTESTTEHIPRLIPNFKDMKEAPNIRRPNKKPLIYQDHPRNINPNFHHDHRPKDIRPRDVIIRTRGRNPKIVYRRYHPLYPINHIIHYHSSKKRKQCKGCKKRRKKRKPRRKSPKKDVEVQHQKDCNDVHHYSTYNQQPPYQYRDSGGYYHPNGQTGHLGYDYTSEPSGYASDLFSNFPTESYPAKSEPIPMKEDRPVYDVREHQNTEDLAEEHENELNADIEKDKEDPEYEDDPENTEEYDEEAEESNPKWEEIFNFPKNDEPARPIKKIDELYKETLIDLK